MFSIHMAVSLHPLMSCWEVWIYCSTFSFHYWPRYKVTIYLCGSFLTSPYVQMESVDSLQHLFLSLLALIQGNYLSMWQFSYSTNVQLGSMDIAAPFPSSLAQIQGNYRSIQLSTLSIYLSKMLGNLSMKTILLYICKS